MIHCIFMGIVALMNQRISLFASHMNQTQEAMRLLRLAMHCEKYNPSPHLRLAAIYQDLNDTTLAEAHYKTALTLAPTHARVHYNIGLFYEEKGERMIILFKYADPV